MKLKFFNVNLGDNGQVSPGDGGEPLNEFDVNMRRPWTDPEFPGMAFVTQMQMKDGVLVPTSVCIGNATTGTLSKDEWKALDGSIRMVAHRKMQLIEYLRSKGCVIPLSNGLGTTVYEYESMSDLTGASLDMDGLPQAQVDRLVYKLESIPLPIISKNWKVNLRHLAASRRRGQPISTNLAAECARVVADYAENMLINGANTFTYGGGTIYGLADYGGSITGNLTGDWSASAQDGADIVADVQAMIAAAAAEYHHGPFVLLVPQRYAPKLTSDYRASDNRTILQRIMALDGKIEKIMFTDFLGATSNDVIMFEPTRDTVAIIEGLPLTDFFWQSLGGWTEEHKLATISVPLLREDYRGQCGIVHYTVQD